MSNLIYTLMLAVAPFLLVFSFFNLAHLSRVEREKKALPSRSWLYITVISLGGYALLNMLLRNASPSVRHNVAQGLFLIALLVQLVAVRISGRNSEGNKGVSASISWLIILSTLGTGGWFIYLWFSSPGAWGLLIGTTFLVVLGSFFGVRNLIVNR